MAGHAIKLYQAVNWRTMAKVPGAARTAGGRGTSGRTPGCGAARGDGGARDAGEDHQGDTLVSRSPRPDAIEVLLAAQEEQPASEDRIAERLLIDHGLCAVLVPALRVDGLDPVDGDLPVFATGGDDRRSPDCPSPR